MIAALPATLAQLGDPVIRRVIVRSVLLTLALFVGLWWGLVWALEQVDAAGWPDWLADAWEFADGGLAAILVIVGLFFLFPAVATTVISLFLDEVVDAVEARHYPHARAARSPTLLDNLRLGLASGLRVLFWNIVALPAYILLLFTAIGPLLLAVAINGWLLGRDYLEMVAVRHLPRQSLRPWIGTHGRDRVAVGLTTALLFLVPFVNLLAPVIGAALATHAFHGRRPEII